MLNIFMLNIMLNMFMACLGLWITLPPFLMAPGHFTMDQMYGLKINGNQLLFPSSKWSRS